MIFVTCCVESFTTVEFSKSETLYRSYMYSCLYKAFIFMRLIFLNSYAAI